MKGREEFGGREVGSGCPRKGRNMEIGSHRLTPRGAPQTGEWLRDAMSLHQGDYSWECISGLTCRAASLRWVVKTSARQTQYEEARVVKLATTKA